MPFVAIENLPDDIYHAISMRAAQNNRSIDEEICAILEAAVKPDAPFKIGTYLAEIGRQIGLTEEEFALFESAQRSSPARIARFD